MKRILTMLVAAAVALTAYPAFAAVNGSPHDYQGVGTYGRCQVCHIPHAVPSGNARLWRSPAAEQGSGAGWHGSIVGKLCGTCHDGGLILSAVGNSNVTDATKTPSAQTAAAYAATSHGRNVATLIGTGATDVKDTVAGGNGGFNRPYMGTLASPSTTMECTSCHNVHFEGAFASASPLRPFLRTNGVAAMNTMSKFCSDCHNRYNTGIGTANASANYIGAIVWQGASRSMHPVDVRYNDAAGNNSATAGAATQLKTIASGGTLTGVVGAMRWPVDTDASRGKFQSDTYLGKQAAYGETNATTDRIGCQTCHAIHNPAGGAVDSRSTWLLAVDNSPVAGAATNGAPLCLTCHGGGAADTMWVGGALKTDATLSDHRIDWQPGGTPPLTNWTMTVRYERHPNTTSKAWPYADQGAGGYSPASTNSTFTAGNGIKIVCTSCHSAHSARIQASANYGSLQRWGYTNYGNASVVEVSAEGWCFSCHPSTDTVPANHHSTASTVGATTADAGSGGNWVWSQIDCSGCHAGGASGSMRAHMGFFSLNTVNDDSDLCMGCHTGAAYPSQVDPVANVNGLNAPAIQGPAAIPNGHLTAVGDKTHYIGTFQAATNIKVKRNLWGTSTHGDAYSKYGTAGQTGKTTDAAGMHLICESCHSVYYNMGDGTKEGGYKINLLLETYEDNDIGSQTGVATDQPGVARAAAGRPIPGGYYTGGNVGSGLCVACHNQNDVGNGTAGRVTDASAVNTAAVPIGLHPLTGGTINRAVDANRQIAGVPNTILYTGGTTNGGYAYAIPNADQTNADGTGGSYDGPAPAPTNAMSCDGCHRPHEAATMGTYKPAQSVQNAGTDTSVILENAGPNAGDFATLCQECHPM